MKIDFYILDQASGQKSLHFACRLLEKAYAENQRVYIQVNSKEEAERLDTFLWTYRDDSFLPHNLYDQATHSCPPPIQIGYNETPKDYSNSNNILLNLSREIPGFFKQFERVIEIVFSDSRVQQLARERYRYYRDQGYEMNTHKLKADET
jgi:DNA polymerase III subunit chi